MECIQSAVVELEVVLHEALVGRRPHEHNSTLVFAMDKHDPIVKHDELGLIPGFPWYSMK